MGMGYRYSGSSSYPRFDRELCEVAKIFGGVESKYIKEKRDSEVDGSLDYWFGFMSSDNTDHEKIVFPEGTNPVLVKWFNNIYGDFTVEETRIVWEQVKKHPVIKDISDQIWNELEELSAWNDSWSIC